jgi:hypothetical protein
VGTIQTYNFSQTEAEDFMDKTKSVVMSALVKEGVLEYEEAEEWSKTHTVILRKKTIFRTITNIWTEATEIDGSYLLVVKLPEDDSIEDDDDGEKEDLPEKGDKENVVELKRRA